jgi:hypothetical protein
LIDFVDSSEFSSKLTLMSAPDLLLRLARADRAWRRVGAAESFLRSWKVVLALVALAVAADLAFQLGGRARLGLSLGGLAALVAFLALLVARAFVRRGGPLQTARLLEERDPSLGSKLVNAIQLREQAADVSRPELTRRLARAAVDEAEAAVGPRDFVPLTKSPTLGRSLRGALLALLVFLVPVLAFAPVAWRELLRFVDPFGDHPAHSFTRLRVVTPGDDGSAVVFRRAASVEVEYDGHRPAELFLEVARADGEGETAALPMFPLGERRFAQQIESVEGELIVRARNRSGRSRSEARRIGVILSPQLEGAAAAVAPPDYTRLPTRETKLALERAAPPTLTVLAGSRIGLSLGSNRPLSIGTLALQEADPKPREFPLVPGEGESAATARAEFVAEESGRLLFDLRDVTGLPADREIAASLVVTHDLPPEIDIAEPTADGYIVESFSAEVAFRASDDYGLKSMRLHLGVNGTFRPPVVVAGTEAPEPPSLRLADALTVWPSELGAVPGDLIEVFGEAVDIRPDPQLARTRTLRLAVVSEEEYNDFLRRQTEIRDLERKYEELHDELRELAAAQRELAAEVASLADAEQPPDQEARDAFAARQAELNAKLGKLAARMESSTRENPLYDLERELQKILDEEATAIRESVAGNQESLADFLEADPSAETLASFAEAGDAQAERLDPLREAAEQRLAEAIADADLIQQLLKAIGAYQELYGVQAQLAAQTAPYREAGPLDDEDKGSLRQMAGLERLVGEGLREVVKQLREGSERARETYPRAAQDALDIAEAIEAARLSPLADDGAATMLAGRGPESHERAEHLRQEMEKLMGECSQCQGGMGGELEARLSLARGMSAGRTFDQMAQCRNFGLNLGPGGGMGGGGMGFSGTMGTGGPQAGPQTSLLGGESLLGRSARESATSSDGRALAESADPVPGREGDPAAAPPRQLQRPSEAIGGEAVPEEYGAVVEAYFRKLTSQPPRQP